MTDDEFWDHVFAHSLEESEWYYIAFQPDIYAIDCARCGCVVEVDDPETRERDAFCDDCAAEILPYEEPAA